MKSHQASKVEFRGHLCSSLLVSCRYPSEIPGAYVGQIRVWLEEVRMVERVKHLEPELQPLTLGEVPVFLYRHVPIEVRGAMKIREEPGSVSERECGRLRERGWIYPVIDRLICWNRVHSGHDVGALVKAESHVVRGWLDGKRQS